jgi:2-methylfumaryl-CoA isomerase
MVVALTPRHWSALLSVTGMTAAAAAIEDAFGVDFSREGSRYQYRETLSALIAPWFAARTAPEALGALRDAGVLCAEYRDMGTYGTGGGQLLADDPLFGRIRQHGIGSHYAAGSPISWGAGQYPPQPAPAVGQHTSEVLSEVLGYSSKKLRDLRDRGVIGSIDECATE